MWNEVYKSLNTLNEYLTSCSFSNEYVSSSPTPGQFTYESELESIHLNSDGAKSRFFEITTDRLKIGDVIEAEVEIANVGSGDLGKIVIVDTADANEYHQFLSTNTTSEFIKLKIKHIIRKTSTYRVGVGISSGVSGNIKIRNFKVKTYSAYQPSNTRKIVIEGHNNFPNKFVIRTDFASDKATISTGIDGLVVTWENPITSSKRPIATTSMDYTGNSPKYIVRIGAVTTEHFILRFYNATTGTLVNIADLDLTESIFTSVVCTV